MQEERGYDGVLELHSDDVRRIEMERKFGFEGEIEDVCVGNGAGGRERGVGVREGGCGTAGDAVGAIGTPVAAAGRG